MVVLPKNASSHKNQQILSFQQKMFLDRMNRIVRIFLLLCKLPDEADRKQSAFG
jgi:hypothetical protein